MPTYRNKRTGEIITVPGGPPANPTFPLQAPKMSAEIGNTQANTQRTLADIQNDRERIALERQRVQAAQQAQARAGEAAQRAAEIAEREKNTKLGNLRAMQNQIARVRDLYKTGPGSTKGVMGAMDYLPTPGNKQFDAAGASLGEIGLSAFRVPGVGSQSDAELRAFVEANRPSASDYDAQIEEKLRNLENRLGEAYKPYGVKYKPGAAPRKPKTQSRVIDFNDWRD